MDSPVSLDLISQIVLATFYNIISFLMQENKLKGSQVFRIEVIS